ncbi:SRPBCC domain-containing protein [Flavobacteriaceae bacterium TP-CH-4]|uniref:SRPBCC domain-containing protein n=1 Tax=Pelagihabitans pacificus TaxID=2696054 RepID=A0A967AV70_9FLAO|nr:SRPBCC domain-containing protein [Pelagihabitans pacificus]NHF60547.1 SRPBCC domain-containing protein [Pelagihabitans pacificus]
MKPPIPVVVTQEFDTPLENIWTAITEVDQMKCWYFDNIPAFKPEVGFETRFNVQSNGRDFLHIWKVTEVRPPTQLVYSWSFMGYEVDSYTVFELEQKGEKSILTLRCYGIESYPDDVPEFTRESCTAGWNYFIKESLPSYIDSLKIR